MENIMERSTMNGLPFPKNFSTERLIIERGHGVWLEDPAGKKYLDFGSGIAVNALGYGNREIAEITAKQMEKLVHISNLYTTEPAVKLAKELLAGTKFSAVHFGNSGSEANETALKYARLYALRTRGAGNHRILSFTGAFHGRTMGALSATFVPKYQDPFQPLVPGFSVCTYNSGKELESILDESFAAVIVEIIQGEAGLAAMDLEFASTLSGLCRKYDTILIVDEIQTGFSRTGSLYAHTTVGLEPDILTLAKPLAGGLPLSATLIPKKIDDLLHIGEHGTTFGGGPVTTAIGRHVLKTLSDRTFIAEVEKKGRLLAGHLEQLKQKYAFLGEVRGRGLLRGIVVDGFDPLEVIAEAQSRGLLILRSGTDVLRFAPPLIITEEELEEGLEILGSVFESLQAKGKGDEGKGGN